MLLMLSMFHFYVSFCFCIWFWFNMFRKYTSIRSIEMHFQIKFTQRFKTWLKNKMIVYIDKFSNCFLFFKRLKKQFIGHIKQSQKKRITMIRRHVLLCVNCDVNAYRCGKKLQRLGGMPYYVLTGM